MVSTAASPGLAGLLPDAGFGIPGLAGSMAGLTLASILLVWASPRTPTV